MEIWNIIQYDTGFSDIIRRSKIEPTILQCNPRKRSKKYIAKRIRVKQQLWWILSFEEECYLWWRINHSSKKKNRNLIDSYYSYNPLLREQISAPLLKNLEEQWLIWENIVDWWAGSHAHSAALGRKKNIVEVDLFPSEVTWTSRIIQDLQKIQNSETFEKEIFEQKLKSKFSLDSVDSSIDFMVMSEVLNYINTKKFITSVDKYLKPWWKILIINEPNRWLPMNLHHYRVVNNNTLINFFTDIWYSIDIKKHITFSGESFLWWIFQTGRLYLEDAEKLSAGEKKSKMILLLITKKNSQ